MQYFVGVLSGTSADAIDAAVIGFNKTSFKLIQTFQAPIQKQLQTEIRALMQPGENELQRMQQCDRNLGQAFATAALQAIDSAGLSTAQITAIGCHGQTIRHHPQQNPSYSCQIGDPNTIAALTGITTVADFRRGDLAHGGQGAPLTPAFHNYWLQQQSGNVAVVNLGGFCNVTLLPENRSNSLGFDTGPANALLDAWYRKQCKTKNNPHYDSNSEWAQSGSAQAAWIKQLLQDDYFNAPAPKSTGHEAFNLKWLEQQLGAQIYKNPANTQATLLELSARSIAKHIPAHYQLCLCGGGANNPYLQERISKAHGSTAKTSLEFGIDPNWVEAAAFAWFAKQCLEKQTANHPATTGATKECILGGVYYRNRE